MAERLGAEAHRLEFTHGAGLRAVGALMAKLAGAQKTAIGADSLKDSKTWDRFAERVSVLQDTLAWTLDDAASGLPVAQQNYMQKIRDKQNTAQDIKDLTDFVISTWESLDHQASSGDGK